MSDGRAFLDTNIFVYTYADSEIQKRETCLSLIDNYDCVTSTQAINEICSVLTRKIITPVDDIQQILDDIYIICEVKQVSRQTIYSALDLKDRYGFSYFDSLMLASALESNCSIIYTEDMADGQVIEKKLKIVNPFK